MLLAKYWQRRFAQANEFSNNSRRVFFRAILSAAILLVASTAFANASLTLQGRILKPDGTAEASNQVQFKVQIKSNGPEACVMYEELRTLDLSSSDGLFTLSVNDGSGTRTDTSGIQFTQVFSNYKAFSIPGQNCLAGAGTIPYAPTATEERKLTILFKDPTMASWEAMPDSTLTTMGMAMEARQIGGFTPQSLLRVEDPINGPQNVSSFTPQQFTSLMNIINGSSAQYVQNSATGGAEMPVLAPSSAPAAGSLWYNAANGRFEYSDGTSIKPVGANSSSTSIPVGNGLTANGVQAGTWTGAGSIDTAPSGVAAGTYTKVDVNVKGVVTGGANLSETDLPTITAASAGRVSGSAITSGTIGGSTSVNTTGTLSASSVSSNNDITNKLTVFDSTNSNKVSLITPTSANPAGTYTLTLPPSLPAASGALLQVDTTGALTWVAPSANPIITGSPPVSVTTGPGTTTISVSMATTTTPGIVLLAPNGGTTASTVVQATDSRLSDSRAPTGAAAGDLTGNYPSPTVAGIRSVPVSATAPTAAGQVLRYNGANLYNPAYIGVADIRSTVGPGYAPMFPINCGTSQTLTYNVGSDTFSCANINIADSQITYNSIETKNTVLAAPTSVNGAPTYRALTTGDLPTTGTNGVYVNGGNSFGSAATLGTVDANTLSFMTQNTTKMTIDTVGNVGIGTTSPTNPLSLQNSLSATQSVFPGLSASQFQVNDAPTTTTGNQASQVILNQPNPGANDNSLHLGLLVDVDLPATNYNFTNATASQFISNNLSTGTLSTQTGGYFVAKNASTGTVTSQYGVRANVQNFSTGNVTFENGFLASIANFSTGTVTNAYGTRETISNNSTGTITNAYGTSASISNTTGTITNAYGNFLGVSNGTGTITNAYGLYVGAINGTNKYSIYASDATSPSYFAGQVGIGTLAPVVSLDLSGATDALALPSGTTAQQPTGGALKTGEIRYNTSQNYVEYYNGTSWVSLVNQGSNSYLSSGGGTLSGSMTITTGGLTVAAGGESLTGGLNNNSGGITNAGTISGATSLTAPTNSNLAIGNSTNGTSLQIQDIGSTGADYVTIKGSAAGGSPTVGTGGSDANIDLSLQSKGTGNILLAPTSGKVGIGTTSPSSILDVRGGNVQIGSGNGDTGRSLTIYGDTGSGLGTAKLNLSGSSGQSAMLDSAGNLQSNYNLNFIKGNGGGGGNINVVDNFAGATQFTINATGQVGIGTTAPTSPLSVQNSLSATSYSFIGTGTQMQLNDAPTSTAAGFLPTEMILNQPNPSAADSGQHVGLAVETYLPSTFNFSSNSLTGGQFFSVTASPMNTSSQTGIIAGAIRNSASGSTLNQNGAKISAVNQVSGSVTTQTGVAASATNISTGNINQQYAINASASNSGGGSITQERAIMASASVSGGSTANVVQSGNFNTTNTLSTITSAYGTFARVTNSGTTTTAYGSYVDVQNTGTIANSYGLYIGVVGGTNHYSLYANDATSPSYFAGQVGIGTLAPVVSLDLSGATDALALPSGTTAQQPTGGALKTGEIRYNTSQNYVEYYNGTSWVSLVNQGSNSYLSSGGGTLSGSMTITTGGLTVAAGGESLTGGLNNNSGGITNAGTISGATSLTAPTNSNLAIGNSTNGTSLQIQDIGSTGADYVTITGAAAGGSPAIGTGGSDTNINLSFAPKGTGNSIFANGNVGIGTTTPLAPLEVKTTSTTAYSPTLPGPTYGPSLRLVNGDNTTTNNLARITFATNDSSSNTKNAAAISSVFTNHTAGSVSADMAIQLSNSGTVAEVARFTSSGFLGIGTSTPAGPLVVQGGTAASSVNGGTITLAAQNGGVGGSATNGGNIILTPGTGFFGTAGGVGIGTTSPGAKLTVQTTAAQDGIQVTTAGTNYPTVSTIDSTNLRGGGFRLAGGNSTSMQVGGGFTANPLLAVQLGTDVFSAGANPYLNITSTNIQMLNGSVGIGTNNPSSTLQVAGTQQTSGHAAFGDSATVDTSANVGPAVWGGTIPSNLMIEDNVTTSTSSSGLINGISNYMQLSPTSDNSLQYTNIDNEMLIPSGSVRNFSVTQGSINAVTHNGTGSVSTALASENTIAISGGGTISTMTGGDFYVYNGSGTTNLQTGITSEVYNSNVMAGGTQFGINSIVYNLGSSTPSHQYGIYSNVSNNSDSSVSYSYGMLSEVTGINIVHGYGLYIPTVSATNAYGVYVNAANATNYFAGSLGVGTNAPVGTLQVYRNVATDDVSLPDSWNHSALTIQPSNLSNASVTFSSTNGGTTMAIQGVDLNFGSYPIALNPYGGNVGIGIVNPTVSLDISNKTDALALPSGTTAQQPTGGALKAGEIRYNTSTNYVEYYNGSSWVSIGSGGGGSYLPLAGGTLTGSLSINNGGYVQTLGASTLGLAINETVLPGTSGTPADNSFDLGQSSNRWRNEYLSGLLSVGTVASPTLYANSGKVGIGTNAPAYNLDVFGTARVGPGNLGNEAQLLIEGQQGSMNAGLQFGSTNKPSLGEFKFGVGLGDMYYQNSTDGTTWTSILNFSHNGNVGIGNGASTSNPGAPLDVETVNTATSGNYNNFISGITANQSSNSSAYYTAGSFWATVEGSANYSYLYGIQSPTSHYGTGTLTNSNGIASVVQNMSSGTISNAVTVGGFIVNNSTGTISNAYSFYATAPANNSTGAITNYYGLYVQTPTAATNNYAIYSQGGNNYFGGKIGVGVLAPAAALDVNGGIDINSVNAIRFPPDSILGRSIAVGDRALKNQTNSSGANTAIGWLSMPGALNAAVGNTVVGGFTMNGNTTGSDNTVMGWAAQQNATTASNNVSIGDWAGSGLTTGLSNVTIGDSAGGSTGSSSYNIAIGYAAENSNGADTGTDNIGIGNSALGYNSNAVTGAENIAIGSATLSVVDAGAYNVSLGYSTAAGITSGQYNLILGPLVSSYGTLTTGSNNILIGTSAAVDTPTGATSNYLSIGNAIYGNLSTGKIGIGKQVPTYQLDVVGDVNTTTCYRAGGAQVAGTCSSDIRLKNDVTNYDLGLDVLLGVQPKIYRLNGLGGTVAGQQEVGVIAQEVEKVAPSLVVERDVKLHPDDAETSKVKAVNYSRFIFIVMNAVREFYDKWASDSQALHADTQALHVQNDTLQIQVQQLQQQNAAMKAYMCQKDPSAPFCN